MQHCLNINFNDYGIGREYSKKNKPCIFDPIRKMLVLKTPEEIVRQKFIRYLIKDLNVPENKIEIEVAMSHFEKGARGRADIVVYNEDNEALFLVECKSPNISLIDTVWEQIFKYDKIVLAYFLIVTNGKNTLAVRFDGEQYKYLIDLPSYDKHIDESNVQYVIKNNYKGWTRPKFDEIMKDITINEFKDLGWIGDSTPAYLYKFIINLAGCFQELNTFFAPIIIGDLNIIEDGERYTSFGNTSGGSWTGDYHYFILEDKNNDNTIVSVSIMASISCRNHPKYGNCKGYTMLIVAIDDTDRSHNSLQLNIDKYTKVDGDKFTVWHDGRMTIGKMGSIKKAAVIEFIKTRDKSLTIENGQIILGEFDCSKEIKWNQDRTKNFIKNIITYAVLRDEYRNIVSKNTNQHKLNY